jgi:hypothetical protein
MCTKCGRFCGVQRYARTQRPGRGKYLKEDYGCLGESCQNWIWLGNKHVNKICQQCGATFSRERRKKELHPWPIRKSQRETLKSACCIFSVMNNANP